MSEWEITKEKPADITFTCPHCKKNFTWKLLCCDDKWISFAERYPDNYPCKGRNYDLKLQDIIIGADPDNLAFKHAFFCKSLPVSGCSMPFTHWQPLP